MAGVLLSSVPTLREEIRGLESKQVTTLANVLLAKGNGGHRSCALLEAPQYRKNCVDTTDAFLAADRSLNDAKTNLSSTVSWSTVLVLFGLAAGTVVDTFMAGRRAKAVFKSVHDASERVLEALKGVRTAMETTAKIGEQKGDPE